MATVSRKVTRTRTKTRIRIRMVHSLNNPALESLAEIRSVQMATASRKGNRIKIRTRIRMVHSRSNPVGVMEESRRPLILLRRVARVVEIPRGAARAKVEQAPAQVEQAPAQVEEALAQAEEALVVGTAHRIG
jgi:hypothetical protein